MKNKTHHFDIDLAVKYGLTEAILINNFQFWIQKNVDNKKNENDSRTWTYMSVKAMNLSYPYLTQKKIISSINRLVSSGVLIKKCLNSNPFDRTSWYAFQDEEIWLERPTYTICQNGEMHYTKEADGLPGKDKSDLPKKTNQIYPKRQIRFTQKDKSLYKDNIQLIKTSNIKDNKSGAEKEKEDFDIFWKHYPKKVAKEAARKSWIKHKPNLEDIMKSLEWQTKLEQWHDVKYVPNASTYINQERWTDEEPPEVVILSNKETRAAIAARSIFGVNHGKQEPKDVTEKSVVGIIDRRDI